MTDILDNHSKTFHSTSSRFPLKLRLIDAPVSKYNFAFKFASACLVQIQNKK